MHFEIASACMKRILYLVGCGGFLQTQYICHYSMAAQFRVFLFCFDKLLFLTFLRLSKKNGHVSEEARVILVGAGGSFVQVNFQACLILIKMDTLVNGTAVVVLEAVPYA